MQKPLDVHLKAKAYAHPFFMFALWKRLLQFFVSVALCRRALDKAGHDTGGPVSCTDW